MKKHAYLIMAYNNWGFLAKLMRLLDDERNDIYLHVDSKSLDFDEKMFENLLCKSNLTIIERKPVYWADFSQTDAELDLLSAAAENGVYVRYHLISGADLPLKTQDEIHDFFDSYPDKEFIGIVPNEVWYSVRRLKYHHIFLHNDYFRKYKVLKGIDRAAEYIQRMFGVNRLKDYPDMKIMDGWTWFSITDDFCRYLLNSREKINKIFKNSIASDELMCQTMAYNSEFRERIYDETDLKNGSMRFIDWQRGTPYTWGRDKDDYELLVNSPYMFARKFDEEVNSEIIEKIINTIQEKNT